MKTTKRLKFLRIATCAGFLAGLFGSFELWFPVERNFPRAPLLFVLPENLVLAAERFLTVALALALVSIIFARRRKIFFMIAVVSLALLVFFDQTRLQPWVYQYFLLLAVFALNDRETPDENESAQTLVFCRIIIASLYFWSGVQKLNYTFAHEILPMLISPLANLFPALQPPLIWPGLAVASLEALTGVGLVFRRTRRAAVVSAVLMHLTILVFLIARNYNQIVWVWNAALIAMVVAAFWKSESSIGQTLQNTGDWKKRAATAAVAASVLLPALSFFGWWDMYLSGALYSGNTEIAVIRLNEDLLEKLPPKARQTVLQVKTEKMLPLFEWAMAELNVPVYPERRVFMKVAGDVCRAAGDRRGIELIIRERPAIPDGSFQITRINCAQLER